jgi:hypothetical protein
MRIVSCHNATCVSNPNSFSYICRKISVTSQRRNFKPAKKEGCKRCFGCKVGKTGCATAQAVRLQLHTAEALVRSPSSPRGVCGQSGTGRGCIPTPRFSAVSIILLLLRTHSYVIHHLGWTKGLLLVTVAGWYRK